MDEGKFNLWRACFSFCFVDGFLSSSEEEWISQKLTTLPFSQQQRQILMSDLKAPPKLSEILPLITRPADRGFLVNHIRMLAKLDKEVSMEEKHKIDMVISVVMSKIDNQELERALAEVQISSSEIRNKLTYSQRLVNDLVGLFSTDK